MKNSKPITYSSLNKIWISLYKYVVQTKSGLLVCGCEFGQSYGKCIHISMARNLRNIYYY